MDEIEKAIDIISKQSHQQQVSIISYSYIFSKIINPKEIRFTRVRFRHNLSGSQGSENKEYSSCQSLKSPYT